MALIGVGWNIWAHAVNRRVARGLISVLDEARAMTTRRVTHRLPRADEPIASDMVPLFETARRELEQGNWTVVGDLMEETDDGVVWGRTRWFIDESETVVGWFSVVRNQAMGSLDPVMMLFSESEQADGFLTARGAPLPVVAQSPAAVRTYCDWGVGLPEVLRRHRQEVEKAHAVLRHYPADLGSGPGVVYRLREANARWRAAQAPDALLVLDVHAMLDPQFDPLGPPLLELLRARAQRAAA